MNVEDGTEKEAAGMVAKLADQSFAQHRLTLKAPGEWRCGREGSWTYGFNVISRPGYLIVYGDIGDWILSMHERDPATGWLPGAVDSPSYLFSKVQAGREEEFYIGDALTWLRQRVGETADGESDEDAETGPRAALNEALNAKDDLLLDDHRWAEILHENDFDSDCFSIGVGPSSRMFWLLEALKVFVKLRGQDGQSEDQKNPDVHARPNGAAPCEAIPPNSSSDSIRR